MDPGLIRKLVLLEIELDRELKYNNGYRTKNYNNQLRKRGLKAVLNSAHIYHKAVDIRIKNSQERFEVMTAASKVGFPRIGVARTFIHLDVDESKPQETLWLY